VAVAGVELSGVPGQTFVGHVRQLQFTAVFRWVGSGCWVLGGASGAGSGGEAVT